jgi:hypothetical protein
LRPNRRPRPCPSIGPVLLHELTFCSSDEIIPYRWLKSAVRGVEEFPTNLALRIEYRIGGGDLNLFCASENLVTIGWSCRT